MILKNIGIAILGGGNMGGALAAGLVKSGRVKAPRITVADIRPALLRSLKKSLGVRTTDEPRRAVRDAGVIFLCVKPQQMAVLLETLRSAVTPRQLVVSVAAGLKTAFFEKRLGRVPVIRAMPNTPALYRAGAVAYCRGRFASSRHARKAEELLKAVGAVRRTSEKDLDAVTALSGSGPAYVFYLAEALAEAGRALGLKTALAEALARQTIYGAGVMLKADPETAESLRRRVTSPGGTTQAALAVLEKAGLKRIFLRALQAARRRSKELSK